MASEEKVALVKLTGLSEKRVCVNVANVPGAASCHPLTGEFDIMVVFGGNQDEMKKALEELENMPEVKSVDLRDRNQLGLIGRGPLEPAQEAEFDMRRGPEGVPFIICPKCGNETSAYCEDCGSAMFPADGCAFCPSGNYICTSCGHRMIHAN